MKNHRDFMGFVANALVVVVILSAIVLGLNIIGVYDLPDSIEKVIGKLNTENSHNTINESVVYDSLDNNTVDNITSELTHLDYDNARYLLENVLPSQNYNQEVIVTNFDNVNERTERFVISNRKGNFDVSVYNGNDVLVKTIKTDGDYVYVTNSLSEFDENTVKIPLSGFSVSDECGFILTHDAFLASDFLLDASTFEKNVNEYGSNLIITFDNEFDEFQQTLKYTISLDYGIVTDAECYEQGVLVYKMNTVLLRQVN